MTRSHTYFFFLYSIENSGPTPKDQAQRHLTTCGPTRHAAPAKLDERRPPSHNLWAVWLQAAQSLSSSSAANSSPRANARPKPISHLLPLPPPRTLPQELLRVLERERGRGRSPIRVSPRLSLSLSARKIIVALVWFPCQRRLLFCPP